MKEKRTQKQKNRWGRKTSYIFEDLDALDLRGSLDNGGVEV